LTLVPTKRDAPSVGVQEPEWSVRFSIPNGYKPRISPPRIAPTWATDVHRD